jgi:amino acid adenylation domain-containing protein
MVELITPSDTLFQKRQQLLELMLQQKQKAAAATTGAIPRRLPGQLPALSMNQRRLWFIEQFRPGSSAYHVAGAVRIRGALDLTVLTRCVREIARRHETLRTRIASANGEPLAEVTTEPHLRLRVTDLEGVPATEREAEARRLIAQAFEAPFDLTAGPLARTLVLRLTAEEHIFLLAFHHLISDAWSIGVFFRNMTALYDAFSQGIPSPLPELPIQYSDYALWQQRILSGESQERLLGFWREQLSGAPLVLDLPTDRPRPAMQSFRGGQSHLTVPSEIAEGLRAISQRQEASLFMALLAGLHTLLFRYTGQETILVGIPVANRNRVELEGMIGLLVNTLVVRVDLSAEVSFGAVLGQIRQRLLAAVAHQDLPFEKLVEELRIERDTSRNPVYQVMFTYQNVPASALDARSLALARYEVPENASRQDLELNLRESGAGLSGWLAYDAGLFEPSTVARLTTHLVHLLRSAAEAPERALADLPMLSAAETSELLNEWNDQAALCDMDRCLHELFEAQSDATPDAVAVEAADATLTYAELEERANRLADLLISLGVSAGTMVAVHLERGAGSIVALLAILKAGGSYVPLATSFPQARMEAIVRMAGVRHLVTQASRAVAIEGLAPLLEHVALLDEPAADAPLPEGARLWTWADARTRSAARPRGRTFPDALAYTIFTSGSTGTPKGVMVRHRPAINLIDWVNRTFQVGPGDRQLFITSLSFDLSVYDVFGLLAAGGTVRVASDEEALDPQALVRILVEEPITFWDSAPAALQQIAPFFPVEPAVGSHLRLVFLSGDWIPVTLPDQVRAAFPRARVISLGGATEATVWSNFYPVSDVEPWWPSIPYGRPIQNASYYVLDASLRPRPIGVPGDLYIGGECLAAGYLGSPEVTADKYVPDPFRAAGGRLYRTGDRARFLSDGNLEFLGRLDQQVKVRGYRIELGEIEAALAQIPSVRDAAVLAQDSPGGKHLVAFVSPAPGVSPTADDLRAALQERLPEFMLPAAFVLLEALPLTVNGKLDRAALTHLGSAAFAPSREFLAPRTPVEETVAGIWTEVLRVPRVGAQDNFFELGGQSLLATQVISRLREAFAVEVPVRALFQHARLSELAEVVEAALLHSKGMNEAPPMERVPRDSNLPLSFAQERLWFIDRLRPGLTAYNIFGAVRMRGQLDVPVLERSFSELIRRHEVLRTTFTESAGRPAQVIRPAADLPIPLVDLREVPAPQRGVLAQRLGNEEAERPFDLSRGPLIRGVLLRVADDDHLLAVTAHHIVYDVWSREIVIRELGILYEAFWHGRPSPLPELAVQYVDFAQWQRAWLQGEVLDAQLAYWASQLTGAGSGTEIPGDRPRPPAQSFRGARIFFDFPEEDSAAVRDLARRQGVTVFMVLLAGFNTLLARITGEDEAVVGSPIANRNRAEIEAMIGFFVNTQVLRTPVERDSSFRALLSRVREVTLGAYANQDLAFEQLVKTLKPQRDTSRQPLFQILFNFLTNYEPIHMELPEVTLTPETIHSGAAQFDLVVSSYEANGRLHWSVDYATDLFDRPTPMRLLHQLKTLLENATRNPEQAVSELGWLPAPEIHQVLHEWNDTAVALPEGPCLHELVEAQVDRDPAATAVVFGETSLTYAGLEAAANRLAHRLIARGVPPGGVVAVHAERSLEMVVALLGVLKAGAAYLPLDPAYPEDRLAYMLEDASVEAVVTHEPTARRLAGRLPPGVSEVRLDAGLAVLSGESAARPLQRCDPGFPAYVIYTSGSTGLPKGAMVHHAAIRNRLLWMQAAYDLTPGERVLQKTPYSFDVSVWEFFWPLLTGACLVVARPGGHQDPAYLARLISEHEVTTLHFVPSMLRLFLEAPDVGALPSLRRVIASGEALPPEVARSFLTRFQAELHNLYGPTEAAVDVTAWACAPGDERVPIGRPIANLRTHVLDQGLRPLPIGVTGELFLGGAGLGLGYLGRPDLTADRFLPSPESAIPGERLYRTGDLVRLLPDGSIEYLGRTDHQVKVRGFRIELGEIEAVLAGLPGVRAGAVVVRKDGAGNHYLASHVVPEEEGYDVDALRRALQARLPEHMVPSAITLLEALPLSPNGKVDRKALAALEGGALPVANVGFVAPATDVEKRLTEIWGELLGIAPEHIGVRDNFFHLGGHSLLTTQLLYRLREAFKVEVDLETFFEAPTVAGLAESIEVDRWIRQAGTEPMLSTDEGDLEECEL